MPMQTQRGRYSSNLFAARHYKEVGDQRHALVIEPPRKTQYPLYRRLDGMENLASSGIQSSDGPALIELPY